MASSPNEMCLQGIMVVVFIILDLIFVLINTSTTNPRPCRHIPQRSLNLTSKRMSIDFLTVHPKGPKAGVKRRTSHEPNRMLMRLNEGEQRVFLICIRFGSCEVRGV